MLDSKRRTGRTTRMLEYAVTLAKAGRAVYILARDEGHAELLRAALPRDLGIKCESIHEHPGLNPVSLKLNAGTNPNCVVLLDHAAIEHRYSGILNELTRYDSGRWRQGAPWPNRYRQRP